MATTKFTWQDHRKSPFYTAYINGGVRGYLAELEKHPQAGHKLFIAALFFANRHYSVTLHELAQISSYSVILLQKWLAQDRGSTPESRDAVLQSIAKVLRKQLPENQ